MTNWFEQLECPVCGLDGCVPASGPDKSPILVIGAYPGEDEINEGAPLVGNMGQNVLRPELNEAGIALSSCRRTNLWLHTPSKNEDCFKHGLESAIHEASNREFILLLGAEPCQVFLHEKISDVSGLVLQSPLLSAKVVVPCINPAYVWNRNATVGELRFALKNFVEAIRGNRT